MSAGLVVLAVFCAGMTWLIVALAIDHIGDALEERAARRRQLGRPLRFRGRR